MFHSKRETERSTANAWERVTENCDLTSQGVVAGGRDKTRMKQAMLNRKKDVAQGGDAGFAGTFGTNMP